jgi:hypothetical protein
MQSSSHTEQNENPSIISEAKRLYDLGFAIHWLRAKSKIPVKAGWTKGPRHSWQELKESYQPGFNLGVRLGEASKINGKYLACLDCDVKSSQAQHIDLMNAELKRLKLPQDLPCVLSGRGNDSKHFYFLTTVPQRPKKLFQSSELVKVYLPSAAQSKRDAQMLSTKELAQGLRIRPAFELSVMGVGQQTALPPSVHPDSLKSYLWAREVELSRLKTLDSFESGESPAKKISSSLGPQVQWQDVDVMSLGLSEAQKVMIKSGEGALDRSQDIYFLMLDCLKLGMSESEILSLFTDVRYFLGQVAFEHTNSGDRTRAAQWLKRYCFKSAKEALENDIALMADSPTTLINPKDLLSDDWKSKIKRVGGGENGPPLHTLENLLLILTNVCGGIPIAKNEFDGGYDYWVLKTPWGNEIGERVKDSDTVRVVEWLSRHFRFEPALSKVEAAFMWFYSEKSFHPVKDFLSTLNWDGKKRMDTWLRKYFGASNNPTYLRDVGRILLTSMVARIYEPGIKFDHVVIFEGEQGIMKSTALSVLAEPWFSDSEILIGEKDTILNIQGTWICEIGELSALRRYDVNRLKEFISRQVDRIRPPFQRRTINMPRQVVFVGTTNNDEYLKDNTGNRRFLPVGVSKIDIKSLRRDRDQLLAEAAAEYFCGADLYLTDPTSKHWARVYQNQRVESDSLSESIAEFLASEIENPIFKDRFSINDLFKYAPCLSGVKTDRTGQMRVTNCLKFLGYKKIHTEFGNKWVKQSNHAGEHMG